MASEDLIDVRVVQITWCSPTIRAFKLAGLSGAALPGFQAGAHVSAHLPVPGRADRVRAYSLVNTDPSIDTSLPQACYRIAVRLDEKGSGGSRQLHEAVRPGDVLRISRPKNEFQLGRASGATLLAGGIGVTPIVSMAAELRRQGIPFGFCYAVRSRDEAVFRDELARLCGDGLQLHVDEEAGHHLDVAAVLGQGGPRPVYVCGPKPMIDATVAAAGRLGWPADMVKFELFGVDESSKTRSGYEVVLQQTGKTLSVGPGQSLLDVLVDEEVDIPYDCRSGFCGLCRVKVLEGDVVHHDTCLTDSDRSQRQLMQACVSHCTSPRLVLDL
ncbi:MAG: PDR/VanB family oxidoreductase [Pigmentiphaga sp.]|uniref:PDR/VanB family oxidoreductase n=1 Tax=Pigmentiphaga sp. TaxID=1977564 RepID=UPI0029A8147D|nr:PDR/VanB family oxidoreductase [Pigmentiphaga sp.]MDX3906362.1 PDR/VanB family oxidoreductase [Pigmentiphaga sp.]